jgi:septal ring factor EnvC (AmiA/AmiB activator)
MTKPAGFLAVAGALLLTAAAPAPAPSAQDVQQAEKSREASRKAQEIARAKATAAAAEEKRLADARVAAAAKLRALETGLASSADRVADLARRRAEARAELDQRAAALAPLLPVIERLARYPAETLLASPQSTEDSVTGVLVLNGLTKQLATEAVQLREEQMRLDSLSAELDAARADLARREAALAGDAQALDRQIEAARQTRHAAEGEAADRARKAAEDAARAQDLRQAIARLETASRAEEVREAARTKQPLPPAHAAWGGPGGLAVPVAGAITQHFGDEVNGSAATGLVYQVPPGARVVAPCAARVVFAGNFRSFGLLTILDCGGGYHAVLSGFDRLDVQLGQNVKQGEPIGAMPGWNPLLLVRRPQLSLELRRDGLPIDPVPYLHTSG